MSRVNPGWARSSPYGFRAGEIWCCPITEGAERLFESPELVRGVLNLNKDSRRGQL